MTIGVRVQRKAGLCFSQIIGQPFYYAEVEERNKKKEREKGMVYVDTDRRGYL